MQVGYRRITLAPVLVALGLIALAIFGLHAAAAGPVLGRAMPALDGGPWLNGGPLSEKRLRGRVVLVEFWTYGCYNCRNVEPHIKAWDARYRAAGLVVVGVHSPELDYERIPAKVRAYVHAHGIAYPVVLDNDYAIWKRFDNHYWPTRYLVDRRGTVRYRHIGEGGYAQTERRIRALLAEEPPR